MDLSLPRFFNHYYVFVPHHLWLQPDISCSLEEYNIDIGIFGTVPEPSIFIVNSRRFSHGPHHYYTFSFFSPVYVMPGKGRKKPRIPSSLTCIRICVYLFEWSRFSVHTCEHVRVQKKTIQTPSIRVSTG